MYNQSGSTERVVALPRGLWPGVIAVIDWDALETFCMDCFSDSNPTEAAILEERNLAPQYTAILTDNEHDTVDVDVWHATGTPIGRQCSKCGALLWDDGLSADERIALWNRSF